MITLEQATAMFETLLKNSAEKYTVQKIWEIQFDNPLYVMVVRDENGKQVFPGEVFPSIQKEDGAFVDFHFPCPT